MTRHSSLVLVKFSILTAIAVVSLQSLAHSATVDDGGLSLKGDGDSPNSPSPPLGVPLQTKPPVDLRTPEQIAAGGVIPGATVYAQTQAMDQGCSNVCEKVLAFNSDTDQWCADHGSPTNPNVLPQTGGIQLSGQDANPISCSIKLLPADVFSTRSRLGANATNQDIANAACQDATVKMFQCTTRTSTDLIGHCQAWKQHQEAAKDQKWLIAFDAAAAVTCGAECAASFGGLTDAVKKVGNGRIKDACDVAAGVASVAEIRAMIQSEHRFNAWRGLGVGAADMSAAMGGAKMGGNLEHLACVSSALFATMAGARTNNIFVNSKNAGKECSAVASFMSNRPELAAAAATPSTPTGTTPQITSAAIGITSGSPGTVLGGIGPADGASAQTFASTDGQMLNRSGLDQILKPKIGDPSAMLQDIQKSGPASAINAMAGAAGLGATGEAVAKAAQAAFEHPEGVFSESSVSGTAMAGGGGGGGHKGGGGDGGLGDLSALFGGGEKGGDTAKKAGSANFRGPAGGNDIWHTNTDQNIFQIVSDRVGKTALYQGL